MAPGEKADGMQYTPKGVLRKPSIKSMYFQSFGLYEPIVVIEANGLWGRKMGRGIYGSAWCSRSFVKRQRCKDQTFLKK